MHISLRISRILLSQTHALTFGRRGECAIVTRDLGICGVSNMLQRVLVSEGSRKYNPDVIDALTDYPVTSYLGKIHGEDYTFSKTEVPRLDDDFRNWRVLDAVRKYVKKLSEFIPERSSVYGCL